MEKRRCPVCQSFLEEIKVEDKYGRVIKVDRCPSGCGVWFDRFELYQISYRACEKLAKDLPSKMYQGKEILLCPVCQIPMIKIQLSYFSREISLDYCKGCSGIWVDRERLLKYKTLQEEKSRREFTNLLEKKNISPSNSQERDITDFIFDIWKKLF